MGWGVGGGGGVARVGSAGQSSGLVLLVGGGRGRVVGWEDGGLEETGGWGCRWGGGGLVGGGVGAGGGGRRAGGWGGRGRGWGEGEGGGAGWLGGE